MRTSPISFILRTVSRWKRALESVCVVCFSRYSFEGSSGVPIEPDDRRFYTARSLRLHARRQHVSAADIDLVFERKRHRKRRMRDFQIAIISDNPLHAAACVRKAARELHRPAESRRMRSGRHSLETSDRGERRAGPAMRNAASTGFSTSMLSRCSSSGEPTNHGMLALRSTTLSP